MKTDKKTKEIIEGQTIKDSFTLDNALYILQHPTVDSKIWAEAVEWLLLYGPADIQEILLSASDSATASCFPDLKVTGYSENGEPVYDVDALAGALGISVDEAQEILERKLKNHGGHQRLTANGLAKLQ